MAREEIIGQNWYLIKIHKPLYNKQDGVFARDSVSFMENMAGWHGKSIDAEELQKALEELNTGM